MYQSESNFRLQCWHTESSMVTHHSIWGRSPQLIMSLVDGRCVLPRPIGWLCLQLDSPPSVAELFRSPLLKFGTLYLNTSSQLPRCSPSGVTWIRFYCNIVSAHSTFVDLGPHFKKLSTDQFVGGIPAGSGTRADEGIQVEQLRPTTSHLVESGNFSVE